MSDARSLARPYRFMSRNNGQGAASIAGLFVAMHFLYAQKENAYMGAMRSDGNSRNLSPFSDVALDVFLPLHIYGNYFNLVAYVTKLGCDAKQQLT